MQQPGLPKSKYYKQKIYRCMPTSHSRSLAYSYHNSLILLLPLLLLLLRQTL